MSTASTSTKNVEVLVNIPVRIDLTAVRLRLRFHPFGYTSKEMEENLVSLTNQIAGIAKPRAIYKVSCISQKIPNSLMIDNMRFSNPLLRANLDLASTVFPYIVTCGRETESIRLTEKNEDIKYCFKIILETLLSSSVYYVRDYLIKNYKLTFLWSLSPGEFQAWPVSQQKSLLALFDGLENKIGITMRQDGSLEPLYSSSGIFYWYLTEFEKCQFCTRVCIGGRRAPYSPELAAKYPELAVRGGCAG